MKEQALAATANQYLPTEEHHYLLLSFYDTLIYYYIHKNLVALYSGSPAPWEVFLRKTIIFENNNHIIVCGFKKIISFARNTQVIFVAHCVWWLASVTGLKQGLITHIDNLSKRSNN